jgi:hypothetical protein
VFASSDFKPVYRARKKKIIKPHHGTVVNEYPTKPGIKFTGKARLERMKAK